MNAPFQSANATALPTVPGTASTAPQAADLPANRWLGTPALPLREQLQLAVTGSIVCAPQALGLIRVSGEDAATFLHTQLTNGVSDLGAGEARLAGYCSPKGRLLATFLVWKQGGDIMLALSGELLPTIRKRLSMFVLRAKASLADAGVECALLAVSGTAVAEALAPCFPTLPDQSLATVETPAGVAIRLPDAAMRPRWLLCLNAPSATLSAPDFFGRFAGRLETVAPEVYEWQEVRAGLPRVTVATQEQFVPQMINFEAIGGVNFRKGCYPGQEIVARTQYRGTVKRRMQVAHVDADGPQIAAGTELFSSADPQQPCGMIVNAAPAPEGGSDLLAEVKLEALENGSVHVGTADGPALAFLPLPYALPSEA